MSLLIPWQATPPELISFVPRARHWAAASASPDAPNAGALDVSTLVAATLYESPGNRWVAVITGGNLQELFRLESPVREFIDRKFVQEWTAYRDALELMEVAPLGAPAAEEYQVPVSHELALLRPLCSAGSEAGPACSQAVRLAVAHACRRYLAETSIGQPNALADQRIWGEALSWAGKAPEHPELPYGSEYEFLAGMLVLASDGYQEGIPDALSHFSEVGASGLLAKVAFEHQLALQDRIDAIFEQTEPVQFGLGADGLEATVRRMTLTDALDASFKDTRARILSWSRHTDFRNALRAAEIPF